MNPGDARQAKDISDTTFIAAVRLCCSNRRAPTATIWDVAAALCGDWSYLNRAAQYARGVLDDPPEIQPYPWMPVKVVRAKARRLIRRGLIQGCVCGCRGDFQVVSDIR